jgi:hypothetical protein
MQLKGAFGVVLCELLTGRPPVGPSVYTLATGERPSEMEHELLAVEMLPLLADGSIAAQLPPLLDPLCARGAEQQQEGGWPRARRLERERAMRGRRPRPRPRRMLEPLVRRAAPRLPCVPPCPVALVARTSKLST